MTFEEWKKQAIGQIDDLTDQLIEDIAGAL